MVVCAVPAQAAPAILYTDGGGGRAGVRTHVTRDLAVSCDQAVTRAKLLSGGTVAPGGLQQPQVGGPLHCHYCITCRGDCVDLVSQKNLTKLTS